MPSTPRRSQRPHLLLVQEHEEGLITYLIRRAALACTVLMQTLPFESIRRNGSGALTSIRGCCMFFS